MGNNKPKLYKWNCYVCGDYIGLSHEPLHLCGKDSCFYAMGGMKISWDKPTEATQERKEALDE